MRAWVIMMSAFLVAAFAANGSTVPGWYRVEPWEIEVCSKWGGTAEAQTYGGTAEGESYMFLTTVTLQAQRLELEGSSVYEVSWYFRPMESPQQYSVMLVGESTTTVYQGAAQPEFGDSNYYADELEAEYEHALLKYETGSLKVPIVRK